jgi:hypothetical protein
MTQPQSQPEGDSSYPASWGYLPAASNAVASAVDVYVAGLSEAEFASLVDRTRGGAR